MGMKTYVYLDTRRSYLLRKRKIADAKTDIAAPLRRRCLTPSPRSSQYCPHHTHQLHDHPSQQEQHAPTHTGRLNCELNKFQRWFLSPPSLSLSYSSHPPPSRSPSSSTLAVLLSSPLLSKERSTSTYTTSFTTFLKT